MSCVIDINVVTHMAVVENERTLRESRALMPEYIDVTDSVFRPYIQPGPVPRCGFQRPPLTHCVIPFEEQSFSFRGMPGSPAMPCHESYHSETQEVGMMCHHSSRHQDRLCIILHMHLAAEGGSAHFDWRARRRRLDLDAHERPTMLSVLVWSGILSYATAIELR